ALPEAKPGQSRLRLARGDASKLRLNNHPTRRNVGMLIPATQLRAGMLVKYQNDLFRVMNVVHVTPGNWRGMVQTKLRKLSSGTQLENRFRSEDKVERVTLEQHEMEFLYQSDDEFHFMNTESYEQIILRHEELGDAVNYLSPNLRVLVEFYEGN